MRNEFAKCEIKTSVFSGRKSQAGNCWTFLDNLRSICSGNGYPTQRAANTSGPRSDRFWLLELRVSRTFLDQLRPQLSGYGYPAQRAANGSWRGTPARLTSAKA